MNRQWAILATTFVLIPFAHPNPAYGATLFSQDFGLSESVSDYVDVLQPGGGQWNAIGTSGGGVTVGIAGGRLEFTRASANAGSFSRTTDFEPEPLALVLSFDLRVSGNSASQTSAAVWQVGSGFGLANSPEANAKVHSRFALSLADTPGAFSVRDIGGGGNSAPLEGELAVTWVINNSGTSLTYLAPDNTLAAVDNDKWDLWLGSTPVLDERGCTTPDVPMTDLKFVFNQGSGSIAIDNFRVQSIPEPRVGLLCAVSGAMLLAARRQFGASKPGR